ncbi:MAG TPA: hypothetical protein PLP29_08740 [Candidatus Ozemobacteraceae bacterium]|nr:hypothetical protein [Candidatus Ozemobacteraceae bacterium]
MILNRRWVKLLSLAALLFQADPAPAIQEIKETMIVTKTMHESLEMCKTLLKTAHFMAEEAHPFTHPRHQARYRFAPSDKKARAVLNSSRGLASRFHLLMGVLCQIPMPTRDTIMKAGLTSADNLSSYAKRALRAIKDGNHALYLASAQGIEKEAFAVEQILKDLEDAVNESIRESDARKEDL